MRVPRVAALGRRPTLVVIGVRARGSLFAEMLAELRFRSHLAVMAWLQERDWYAGRNPVQWVLIVVALIALACGVAILIRWRRPRGDALVALIGTAAALAIFFVEAISAHGIDAVIYGRLGPVLTIAWLWAGAAVVVTVAALRGVRSARA